jgi:hypothetical protein
MHIIIQKYNAAPLTPWDTALWVFFIFKFYKNVMQLTCPDAMGHRFRVFVFLTFTKM